MTIPFGDTVKAQLTQAVISSLLEAGGYRVIRLGIEELFREVKSIELEQYRAMNLPAQLRYLPDLLVTSTATNQACLVEVKFRRRFDDSSARALFEKLERQRRYWPHGRDRRYRTYGRNRRYWTYGRQRRRRVYGRHR